MIAFTNLVQAQFQIGAGLSHLNFIGGASEFPDHTGVKFVGQYTMTSIGEEAVDEDGEDPSIANRFAFSLGAGFYFPREVDAVRTLGFTTDAEYDARAIEAELNVHFFLSKEKKKTRPYLLFGGSGLFYRLKPDNFSFSPLNPSGTDLPTENLIGAMGNLGLGVSHGFKTGSLFGEMKSGIGMLMTDGEVVRELAKPTNISFTVGYKFFLSKQYDDDDVMMPE